MVVNWPASKEIINRQINIYYPRRLCRSAWVGFSSSSVCLFVCPQHNSKKNDPKVFKLGVGMFGYPGSGTVLGFKGQGHRVNNTRLHNNTSFRTTITFHSHSLGGDRSIL